MDSSTLVLTLNSVPRSLKFSLQEKTNKYWSMNSFSSRYWTDGPPDVDWDKSSRGWAEYANRFAEAKAGQRQCAGLRIIYSIYVHVRVFVCVYMYIYKHTYIYMGSFVFFACIPSSNIVDFIKLSNSVSSASTFLNSLIFTEKNIFQSQNSNSVTCKHLELVHKKAYISFKIASYI